MKKLVALLLSAFMAVGIAACGKQTPDKSSESKPTESAEASAEPEKPAHEADTLVLATQDMNEIFSTFDAKSVYDVDVANVVQRAPLLDFDEKAEPSNTGISDYYEPVVNADGTVDYKFVIRDGVVFSDGTPVTVDDVIFNFKVYMDPNYTGNATLYTLPIEGAMEYRYDDPNYAQTLEDIKTQVEAYAPTEDEIKAKAQALLDAYKTDMPELKLEDFLEGGDYYEDETIQGLTSDFKTKLEADYISEKLGDGIDIPEITGLRKISDKELQIHMTRVDPSAIYSMSFNVLPKSYYGEGFSKGKLDGVRAKEKQPFGAGPYIFKGYANNVVSFEANPKYYRGEPKIKKLKMQVVQEANKIDSLVRGETDISDPSATPENMAEIEKHENLYSELVDNNGYGYIGINAERVPDKLVRQGLMYLMDRGPAIEAHYGELASVIERPISRTNWAYPEGATEYYGFSPEKALAKFKEAGYEQVDGKLVKDGKQLVVTLTYPGGDTDTHPVKPLFSKMKEEGEKLGMTVNLENMGGTPFFAALDGGTLDVWAAAWQSVPDPDMTQLYKGGAPSNHYKINNAELDQLIDAGLKTMNIEERKEIYHKAQDIVMDEAVEMPFYQRKNLFVYNQAVLDIDSLPENLTPYWDHKSALEKLELVAE